MLKNHAKCLRLYRSSRPDNLILVKKKSETALLITRISLAQLYPALNIENFFRLLVKIIYVLELSNNLRNTNYRCVS